LIDLNKSMLIAVRTGRVILGSDETFDAAKNGRGRLLILANNCMVEEREEINRAAELSGIDVFTYPGSSLELGDICGKPFPVAAMIIREPGDSDILELVEDT